MRGKIQTVETPFGRRICSSVLLPYLDLGRPTKTQEAKPQEVSLGQTESVKDSVTPTSEDSSRPLESSQDSPNETQEVSLGQAESVKDSVPLVAHLAALDLAGKQMERMANQIEQERRRSEAAERAKLSLEGQLAQYQRALAENAESLAEERAKRMQLESKATNTLWGRFRRFIKVEKSA